MKQQMKLKSKWVAIIENTKTGEKRTIPFKNTFLKQWKVLFNSFMAREETDAKKLWITHEQLGYDDTAANENQTGLINPEPTTKKVIASLTYQDKLIRVLSFWDENEAIGHWKEFTLIADELSQNMSVVRAVIDLNVESNETLTIHGELEQI